MPHAPHPSTVTSSLTSSATTVSAAPQVGQGGSGSGTAAMTAPQRTARGARAAVPPVWRTASDRGSLQRMRSDERRSWRSILLLLLLVAAAACTTGAPKDGGAEIARPVVTPEPTMPAPPEPEPTPPPLPEAAPLVLDVTHIHVAPSSNAAILGVPEPMVDDAAALAATQAAADRMVAFLQAMLVTKGSYFSDAALATLLDPAGLDAATRSAAGVLDGADVLGTRAVGAQATASVLINGSAVQMVSLSYSASADLVLTDGEGPVTHAGVISFAPAPDGALQVTAWDPVATYGGALEGLLS